MENLHEVVLIDVPMEVETRERKGDMQGLLHDSIHDSARILSLGRR